MVPTSYKLHCHTLDIVEASKYLGITISNNLTWDKHTNNTVGKGNRTLGLGRKLKGCTKHENAAEYVFMIKPAVEYEYTV